MRTPDGRILEAFVGGPADGLPLVFHVGTPAAATPFPWLVDLAEARGLRTVIYSRPGYGTSTPRPGRRVADAVADVTAILDDLGAESFVTIGWSGGGPHALACGALLRSRCRRIATIGGPAPNGDGFDWSAGMGDMNLEGFALTMHGGQEYYRALETESEFLRTARPEQLAEHFASLLSPPDVAALAGPVADFLANAFRHSVRAGTAGWADDEIAFVRQDWGFRLEEVRTTVDIWQGGQDLMTPPNHAQWLNDHLPDATYHLYADEGHVSLVARHLNEILDALLSP